MNHTPGLLAATRRADRARLLRFFAVCDPAYRFWLGGRLVPADAMPTDSLRTAAFCVADHFWAVRRTRRFWRNYPAHIPSPQVGHAFPVLHGAALDAWLAEPRHEPPVFTLAAE